MFSESEVQHLHARVELCELAAAQDPNSRLHRYLGRWETLVGEPDGD